MNYKKAKCQHCNNETLMEVRDINKIEQGNPSNDDYCYDMQVVLFCPTCHNYNIINAYWDNTYGKKNEIEQYEEIYGLDRVEESIIFPVPSNLISQKSDLVPKNILHNLEKSYELKNIDEESCLVKLRKTLEIICNDKNANGPDLYHKIANLSERGILPNTLNSASTITRKLGNIGAHEDLIDISSVDLKIVIELVEYIIQYIYVLPKEIERLESKFLN